MGAGRRLGFKKEDQRRENALGVEGKRYTKAKRAESSRHDKRNTGQLRAAASMPIETGREAAGRKALHSLHKVCFFKYSLKWEQ